MIGREPRIDTIRGWAILIILVNHLTQVAEFGGIARWTIPTPTQFGYSTAAELFVIISGYMVGLIYLSRPEAARIIARRAATLWAYNVALLAIVLPLVAIMSPEEAKFWRLDSFVSAPLASTFHFLTLWSAPRLLDVLQLYVTLMLVSPIAIWLGRRSPSLLISASVALYVVAQVLTILHLSHSPEANTDGTLDLLSWQMLFFVPMGLGRLSVHRPLFRWLENNRMVLIPLLLLFLVGALTKHFEAHEWLARPEWLTGRYGLHILRLAHAIMVLLLYASALSLAGRYLQHWPFRAVATVGRHSLNCFAVGVIATYGLGVLWVKVGGGYLAYYTMELAGVSITIALAYLLDTRAVRQKTQGRSTMCSGDGQATPHTSRGLGYASDAAPLACSAGVTSR